MLAYHNNPKIKQEILQQLQYSDYNISIDDIDDIETRLGIPRVLVYLQDAIFDELPTKVAIDWSIRFMSAIPVGANLSGIWREFAVWLLIDPIDGVIQYTTPGTEAYEVIIKVANLYQHGHTTQQMTDAAYDAAYAFDAANAAAAANAFDAADFTVSYAVSYAVSAAYNAAAVRAAAAVVYAACAVAVVNTYYDATDARDVEYIKMSNKLIELLENLDKTRTENASLP